MWEKYTLIPLKKYLSLCIPKSYEYHYYIHFETFPIINHIINKHLPYLYSLANIWCAVWVSPTVYTQREKSDF